MSEYGYDYERKQPDGSEIGNDVDNTSAKPENIESPSVSTPEISEQGTHAVSEQDFSTEGLSALQDSDTSNSSLAELNSFDSSDQKLSPQGMIAIQDENVSSFSSPKPDSSTRVNSGLFPSDDTGPDNSIKQSESMINEKTLDSRNSDFTVDQFQTELPGRSLRNEDLKTNSDLALQEEKSSKEYSSSVELDDQPDSKIGQNIEAMPRDENSVPITSTSPDIPVYDPKLEKEPPKEVKEPPSGSVIKPANESIAVNPNGRSTFYFGDDSQQDNSEMNGESNLLRDLNSPATNKDASTSQVLVNDQKINRNEIVLENGEKVITTGGVQAFKDLNHQQGEVEGFEGTCGLCSVQCVSNQFGLTNEKGEQISEKDVVTIAKNEHPPLCVIESNPENNGGTSQVSQQILLEKLGIPAHVESGKSMDQLAQEVEQGKGVIAGMEATELWGENLHKGINLLPRPNHAVTVIDTARDPGTNKLKGFFINDSGNNYDNIGSGRFVSVGEMQFCWQNHGGSYVVTNHSFLNSGANKWI